MHDERTGAEQAIEREVEAERDRRGRVNGATSSGVWSSRRRSPSRARRRTRPSSIRLDADGVVGDRRSAVLTDTGDLLTADTEPRLRDVLATAADDGSLCSPCRPSLSASGAWRRTRP